MPNKTLKVACINLWMGGVLWESLIAFMKQVDADIVLLQEVFNSLDPTVPSRFRSMHALRQALQYPYDAFAPAFIDTEEIGLVEQGNAILSKYPIRESHVTFFQSEFRTRTAQTPEQYKTTPRNLQHVVIEVDGTAFNVFNTQGVWNQHGEDTPGRLQMGKTIASAVRGLPHVILGGDFNASPDTQTIGLIERELTPVFGSDVQSTFNMKQKTDPVFSRVVVDLFFVSNDIQVLSKDVPQVDVSDHLPLILTLARK